MDELKKLYLTPEAQILCFKPFERLAAYGGGVVGDGEDITFENGESGGEDEDYDGE